MKSELANKGFKIVENVYSENEILEILALVHSCNLEGQFGVREFLYNHPNICEKIINPSLKKIIHQIDQKCNKSIKSIYFDKPPKSNWKVNWHQDLTINLMNRKEVQHYTNWRKKGDRVIVQPNKELLEQIFTIRIHLDDCTASNGALRVIENSHKRGPINIVNWTNNRKEPETICEVSKGGILIMKPLILHASRRSENNQNRRVIHIEFTNQELPQELQWKEKIEF